MRIEYLKEVSSTNDYIRRYLDGGEDVIVCAERQSAGRGTKGRSFLSEKGGVYLTALTFPKDLPACEAFTVMTHAAVSVCRTVASFGAVPEIKWPNDILVGGRKIAGILIENMLSGEFVRASVVGIGLNVSNDLTGLSGIATRLSDHAAATVFAARERLIEAYGRESDLCEYLSFVRFLGRTVTVKEGDKEYLARAKAILPDGRLEIEADGTRALSAAEISIGW